VGGIATRRPLINGVGGAAPLVNDGIAGWTGTDRLGVRFIGLY
jgi:hypothetical protein